MGGSHLTPGVGVECQNEPTVLGHERHTPSALSTVSEYPMDRIVELFGGDLQTNMSLWNELLGYTSGEGEGKKRRSHQCPYLCP